MHILTEFNVPYDLDLIDEEKEIDFDLRYCVLDYSNPHSDEKLNKDGTIGGGVDFNFLPLVFLDSYVWPAADLQIGPYRIQMPLDWTIVIADKGFGTCETIEIKSINDRDFTAFCLNPLRSYIPDFFDITIQNIFPDVSWRMPKLKYGHILAVPLDQSDNPICAFFVRDTNRLPDSLDITKIF